MDSSVVRWSKPEAKHGYGPENDQVKVVGPTLQEYLLPSNTLELHPTALLRTVL